MLDGRMKEVRVTEDGGNLNITILESARPNLTPVSPVKSKMLGMGMLGGLLAGVAIAMVMDLLDQRFRSVDEMVQLLDVQILATVPHILGKRSQSERGQEVHLRPKSDVSEAYRTMRTAVYFGLPDEGAKSVLVTSAAPGDGKSTTAANLAIAMAQAGRRVLLIDADCRKPTQHKIFKLSAETGLSTVLLGRSSLQESIQRTSTENPEILPCGPLPAHPAELLDSQVFIDVLNQVSMKYDQVIIDSAPVGSVTDARIIAASCDSTLLVLRAQRSKRRVTAHAVDVLSGMGGVLIGAVVNDVARGERGNSYYAHDGKYGYGYGADAETASAANENGRIKAIVGQTVTEEYA
jgi:capsular exopolysaccharide synthesis family protein